MTKRMPPRLLRATGTRDASTFLRGDDTWATPTGPSGGLPVIDVVADHGAAVDGTTDDTTAWQAALDAAGAAGGGRIISSIAGVSIIGGALQDTSGANAQLLLPAVDYGDDECVTIVIEGAIPPPSVVAVGVTTPLPDNQLVLKSTLTTGSGGALLGGVGPTGTTESFTNVDLYLRNVTFRMPSNPTHTALNLLKVACVDLDNVVVDAGSYSIPSISVPTTSTSYGIKLPDINNGAHTRLGRVDVVGFYNGFLYNEHTLGQYVTAWACKIAHTFAAGYHDSGFSRLAYYHCQTGLKFTGDHYVTIDRLNIEHAASGTWAPAYDIDDASNHGHGKVKYHVVKAGVGVSDGDWTVNGATGITASPVGTEAGAASLIVKDEGTTLTSAATSINFVGSGVTVTNTGGDVTATIPGATSTTGELLMQDGVTAPPVPIENEARSDWLYQG